MLDTTIKRLVAIFAIVFLASCASETSIYTETNIENDSYQTFSWPKQGPMFVRSDYPIADEIGMEVRQQIKTKLETKGYRFIEDQSQADLVVLFSIGAQNKVKAEKAPSYFSENGRWGSEFLEVVGDQDVKTYVEGSLAIDIFDRERRQQVWFGAAKKKLDVSDKRSDLSEVSRHVSEILSKLPDAEQS
ncbi:DUF4136 domain-containing protein [Glaciecola sp. MH2013]|uniref:DUF4136 domain-containing protein n=1 Tax=Glaciecola sp. MH2013 TaxID=2785524 RepID=UPI00189E6BE7|nr:DUF4136 domain-containing protein [Glaciecola sp. MH2013]MBF7074266.1 DUF4136 domain-containing protein [Glaciecola sp. MH2013]